MKGDVAASRKKELLQDRQEINDTSAATVLTDVNKSSSEHLMSKLEDAGKLTKWFGIYYQWNTLGSNNNKELTAAGIIEIHIT